MSTMMYAIPPTIDNNNRLLSQHSTHSQYIHNSPNTLYTCSPPEQQHNIPYTLLQQQQQSIQHSPLIQRFNVQRQYSDYFNNNNNNQQQYNNNVTNSPNTHPSNYNQPLAIQLNLFNSPATHAIPYPLRHVSQYNNIPPLIQQQSYSDNNAVLQQNLFLQQQQQLQQQPIYNTLSLQQQQAEQYNEFQPLFIQPTNHQRINTIKQSTSFNTLNNVKQHNNNNFNNNKVNNRPYHARPVIRMTHKLMHTYNTINDNYYQQQSNNYNNNKFKHTTTNIDYSNDAKYIRNIPQHKTSHTCAETEQHLYDDKESNYIARTGEYLSNNRYKIIGSLGKGSFGRVVKCIDIYNNNKYVAIKIIKSKTAFMKQAQIEIDVLNTLQNIKNMYSATNVNILTTYDTFVHYNHQCIVFELYGNNLYDLLKYNKFNGLNLQLIAIYGLQLCSTLNILSNNVDHSKNILHCDLKPENILLDRIHEFMNSSSNDNDSYNSNNTILTESQIQSLIQHNRLTVIDYGSACYNNSKLFTYIQSRFYRAPEVLLGLPYTTQIDVFSLGCVLYELYIGKPLFDGYNESEQVIKQCNVLGIPPHNMLINNRKAEKYFAYTGNNNWRIRSRYVDKYKPISLNHLLKQKYTSSKDIGLLEQFEDLLRKMLHYDPTQRIKPTDALYHPFFTMTCQQYNMNYIMNSVMNMSTRVSGQPVSTHNTISQSHSCNNNETSVYVNGRSLAQHVANTQQQQIIDDTIPTATPVINTLNHRAQSFAIPVHNNTLTILNASQQQQQHNNNNNTSIQPIHINNNSIINEYQSTRKRSFSSSHTSSSHNNVALAIDISSPNNPMSPGYSIFQQHMSDINFSPKIIRTNTHDRVVNFNNIDLMNYNEEYKDNNRNSISANQMALCSPPLNHITNASTSSNAYAHAHAQLQQPQPQQQQQQQVQRQFVVPRLIHPHINKIRRASDADQSFKRSHNSNNNNVNNLTQSAKLSYTQVNNDQQNKLSLLQLNS